jgi:hypothetical protein
LYEDIGQAGYRIEIQGSNDGTNWNSYRYRCLTLDDKTTPRLVWPYQCRLDWHMWRASKLGFVGNEPLLRALVWRLGSRSPQVTSLFESAPSLPPRRFRVVLSEFHFAKPAERERGSWWTTRVISVQEFERPGATDGAECEGARNPRR